MKRLISALLFAPMILAAQSPEQRFTLPNGLRVLLLEDHALPQVRVHLALDFESRGGMGPFTGALMEGSGAGPLNAVAFAHALEERGAWLQPSWRPGTLEWRLQVGSAELEGAMELLGHTVFRPVYDASRVERLRGRMLRQVQERSPRERALDLFLGALGHPEGGKVPPEPTLRRITFPDLVAFRREISDPRRAVVAIRGDVSLPLARQVMLQNFGTWTPAPSQAITGPEDVLDTIQVGALPPETWCGRRIIYAHEAEGEAFDLLKAVFAQRALSEDFRLEWVRGDRRAGVILAWSPNSQAELLDRLGAIARQGLTQAELDRAREGLNRQRAMLALHPEKQLEEWLDQCRAPKGGSVEVLQLAQVRSLLETWLKPEGLRFLVVKSEAEKSNSTAKSPRP